METSSIENRLAALEKAVLRLESIAGKSTLRAQAKNPENEWWLDKIGVFANDPVFDEIVEEGRKYRRSLDADDPNETADS